MNDSLTLGSNIPRKGNAFTAAIGSAVFKFLGWKFEGEVPNLAQMILPVAPHSSNMDFIVAIAAVFKLRLRVSYFGKHTLFKFPLGWFMRSTGGIPVNRGSSQGLTGQMVEAFNQHPQLILGLAPEGTRGKVTQWKKGFAVIAQATNVPVLTVLLDYANKTIRFMPLITDVGDVDKTMEQVQAYTATAKPKNQN
ncbi:MAG: acyltransferase [Gammaproteobacteria bacterium]|nr:lysophospholipid acyltransferase family protein [Gammaproteobacteria bacterium]NNC97727.1 acyltransferase [Gammaproteobacteria bacterium]NNM14542.1 acyltransferase [Gammaproteobacteria bacterium]